MFLILTACVPHLYSDIDQGEPWQAPENSWPVGDTPSDLVAGGFSTGDVVPELLGFDQHDDDVSSWQFYGHTVVLDISTMWCAPCQELAKDVEETAHHYEDDGVIYITVLPENLEGSPPDLDDLNAWADNFGITAPVIADHDGWHLAAVPDGGFPRILVVGQDMTVCAPDVEANDPAVRAAIETCL